MNGNVNTEEDPLKAMRDAYQDVIDSWSESVDQMIRGEDYAAAAGQLLKRYVDFQWAIRDSAVAAADSLHMPTKDDLARVATLIINVERKVDQLSDEFAGLAKATEAAQQGVPEAVEKRLAKIETSLEGLGTELGTSAKGASAVEERLAKIQATLDAIAKPAPKTPRKASSARSSKRSSPTTGTRGTRRSKTEEPRSDAPADDGA